jgi:hypothetical protein
MGFFVLVEDMQYDVFSIYKSHEKDCFGQNKDFRQIN